jgi:hypothetical protein
MALRRSHVVTKRYTKYFSYDKKLQISWQCKLVVLANLMQSEHTPEEIMCRNRSLNYGILNIWLLLSSCSIQNTLTKMYRMSHVSHLWARRLYCIDRLYLLATLLQGTITWLVFHRLSLLLHLTFTQATAPS